MTASNATAVTYGYDDANRLTTVKQGTAAVSMSYDDANRIATLALPNGIVATYAFDPTNKLTSLTYARQGSVLDTMAYGYDAASRNTSFVSTLGQLNKAFTARPAATFDAADQLVSLSGVTYTYDSNGNLTFDGVNRYVWDARNQLIAVSGVGAANYAYDAIGRRTAQTQGSTTTTYLHDRGNLIQESRGGEMAHYMTGPALDQVFSRSDSNGTETYLRDGLGSILGLADATGNIVTQYQYGPYGDTTAAAGAGRNSLQYGGRENDENGLYFYRARYYKPAIGRFISQDPIGLVAGVNRYAYADGNPVQLDDPTGLYGAVSTTITGGLDGLGGQISTTTNVNGTITTQTGFGFGAGGSVSTTFTDSAPGDLGPSPGVTYGVAYSDTITLGSLTFNVDASVDSSGDWSLDGSLSLPYGLGDWGGELSPNGFRRQRSRGIGESGFLGFFRRETRCP